MDAKLSDGYGSEFIVLDAKTQKPVTGVVILSPMSDRLAFDAIGRYLEAHSEVMPALATRYMTWQTEWRRIDEAAGDGGPR
jgi:hypothetical protein